VVVVAVPILQAMHPQEDQELLLLDIRPSKTVHKTID